MWYGHVVIGNEAETLVQPDHVTALAHANGGIGLWCLPAYGILMSLHQFLYSTGELPQNSGVHAGTPFNEGSWRQDDLSQMTSIINM